MNGFGKFLNRGGAALPDMLQNQGPALGRNDFRTHDV